MTFPTQLYRDYFINHEIRIPSLTNQDSMKSRFGFFFVAQLEDLNLCPAGYSGNDQNPSWVKKGMPNYPVIFRDYFNKDSRT